jgi:3-methyl-2-oxobutanoate hydroxymethyltransferase
MKSVLDFAAAKAAGRKISMVTCYDAALARVLEASKIDCILVGDSAAMVVHGHADTLAATADMMALHTAAVRRGAPTRFLIGDMPFLTFRKGVPDALDAVAVLMRAGAQAVKLEGVAGHEDVIAAIVGSGVPVMGHLGLTPQSVNALAGFRVQGRRHADAVRIIDDAKRLEELGCFSIVLECVPSALGAQITQAVKIPTIGVGAGPQCDGQVLVLHDLLGFTGSHRPKFVRTYLDCNALVREAVDRFDAEVKQGGFPTAAESYDP